MKLHLPNSAFLGNIDPFLRSFDPSDPSDLEITANSKWISVHPVVLSMLASLGSEVISVKPFNLEARSRHYLKRMGLFEFLNIDDDIDIEEHDPSGRFIPLTNIRSSQDLSDLIKEMIPLLHLEPDRSEPMRYVISELVRNVIEHSGSPSGAFVCAQYYGKSNVIRVGIADRGIGIRESISRSHLAPRDLDAIRLSLMPGITGSTRREGGTDINAGAGLFFIRSIANVNRDFLLLYSGKAMYKLLRSRPTVKRRKLHGDPFKDRHSTAVDLPFWKGTVVGIDISLDANREFTDLLDMIRRTYVRTIRERKENRYRRPRFI